MGMAWEAGGGHALARRVDDGPAHAVACQPPAPELATGPQEEHTALRPEQPGPVAINGGAVEGGPLGVRGVVRGMGPVAKE